MSQEPPTLHLVVASQNPVKIAAAQRGFQKMFAGQKVTVEGVSVPSGVSNQPRSDAETRQGALNRSWAAQQGAPQADYWIGIEGGIEDSPAGMCAFAWVVVRSQAGIGQSRSGAFFLPPAVAAWVRIGLELGEADDRVFGRVNSKQENGAIGILTGDVLDRAALYEQAVILALVPFKNEGFYTEA